MAFIRVNLENLSAAFNEARKQMKEESSNDSAPLLLAGFLMHLENCFGEEMMQVAFRGYKAIREDPTTMKEIASGNC